MIYKKAEIKNKKFDNMSNIKNATNLLPNPIVSNKKSEVCCFTRHRAQNYINSLLYLPPIIFKVFMTRKIINIKK